MIVWREKFIATGIHFAATPAHCWRRHGKSSRCHASALGWLPVRHFRGFWTAVVDVDLDPY